MFAIIEASGTQYKVEKGQILEINKMEEKEGSTITFENVLLIDDGKDTKIGTPFVEGASVSAKVADHKRGDKIRVFKMKPKKRYQKTQGHRQELTTVEITDIKASGSKKAAPKKETTKKTEEKAPKKTATKKAPAKKKAPAASRKKAEK